MDANLKSRWIAALLSGDYQQTTGALQKPNKGFCCLGVLCDLLAKDGIGKWQQSITNGGYNYEYKDKAVWGLLASNLRDDIGIPYYQVGQLAMNNDNGKSFVEIAKLIEEIVT